MKKNIIALLSLVCTLYGCTDKKASEVDQTKIEKTAGTITLTQEQFKNNAMALGSLEEKSFPVTVSVNGMIDVPPENRAVVSAVLGGYIKRTPLLIGDTVQKGQALVTLENPEFISLQQEYLEVQQQLVYLRAEYERQKTLQQEQITSQKRFLKAESEFKTASARYNGLKKQLTLLNIAPEQVTESTMRSTTTLYAPIKGSVTQMNVNRGTYVSPASPILEIIDNDHIHLELSVYEKDIMKISKGQSIRFQIPEASERYFEAEVYLIGSSIDENRTIKVHAHLKNEGDHNFLNGMFVNAEIITENTMAKGVPTEAVVEESGKFYLLKEVEHTSGQLVFRPIEVYVGKSKDGFREIKNTDTFRATDRFLTKGAFDVFGG